MAEALSDDGKVTGPAAPLSRGVITGFASMLGGMLHILPFLIANLKTTLHFAYMLVAIELFAIPFLRYRFIETLLWSTILQVIIGGAIVLFIGIWLGRPGVSD